MGDNWKGSTITIPGLCIQMHIYIFIYICRGPLDTRMTVSQKQCCTLPSHEAPSTNNKQSMLKIRGTIQRNSIWFSLSTFQVILDNVTFCWCLINL